MFFKKFEGFFKLELFELRKLREIEMSTCQIGWVIMFLFGSGKEMNFSEFFGLYEVQDWYFLLELRGKG